jgi:hypothetical protein
MSEKDLNAAQRSVLLILMAEGEEIPNTLLTNHYGFKFDSKLRDDLKKRGLVATRTEKNRVYLSLGDKGWDWCAEQFSAPVPKGSSHGGAAAYALLASVLRYTEANRANLSEFFVRMKSVDVEADPEEAIPAADVELRIRNAYAKVASTPGAQVRLTDLRAQLDGLNRADVDATLEAMSRQPSVHVYPESRQSTLTAADDQAAIRLGNQANHLIVID